MKLKEWTDKHFELLIILGISTLILVVAGGIFLTRSLADRAPGQTTQVTEGKPDFEDANYLASFVSTLINLPSDESPIVASVTDSDKLKTNPFLAQAQNGDKILVYKSINKAILFRPTTAKIIEIASLSATESAESSPSATQTVQNVEVVIKNGTTTKGLAAQTKPLVEKVKEGVKVTKTENAEKTDYEKTIVVALDKSLSEIAGEIAKAVSGEVLEALPEGEKDSGGQIIVILGGK